MAIELRYRSSNAVRRVSERLKHFTVPSATAFRSAVVRAEIELRSRSLIYFTGEGV